MNRQSVNFPYICFAGRNHTEWRRHDGTTFIERHRRELIPRAERRRRRGIPRKR